MTSNFISVKLNGVGLKGFKKQYYWVNREERPRGWIPRRGEAEWTAIREEAMSTKAEMKGVKLGLRLDSMPDLPVELATGAETSFYYWVVLDSEKGAVGPSHLISRSSHGSQSGSVYVAFLFIIWFSDLSNPFIIYSWRCYESNGDLSCTD